MQGNIDLGKAKRGLLIVILLGVLAITVIIALTFNKRTLGALAKIDITFLFLAILAMILSWIFSALPFYILTRVVRQPISFASSLFVYLGGSFFGLVTPFGSGLIPAQVFILTGNRLSPGQAAAVTGSRATISSWLFVLLGAAIFLAFGSSLSSSAKAGILGIAIAAAVWSLIILFFIKLPEKAKSAVDGIFNNRLVVRIFSRDRLGKAKIKINSEIDYLSSSLKDLFSYSNAPAILTSFLSEIIAWLAIFSVLPLILFGFGVRSNFAQLVFRLFLLFSVAPASPVPGGSGLVEGALAALLSGLAPTIIKGVIVLIWRLLTYYLTLLIGGIVVLRLIARSAHGNQTR